MLVKRAVRLLFLPLLLAGWLAIGLVLPFIMLIEWAFDFGPPREVWAAWRQVPGEMWRENG